MAEVEAQASSTPKDIWIKPVVVFLKSVWLFIDVGTLMVRFLINTLLYDSPLGKTEGVEGGSSPAKG